MMPKTMFNKEYPADTDIDFFKAINIKQKTDFTIYPEIIGKYRSIQIT